MVPKWPHFSLAVPRNPVFRVREHSVFLRFQADFFLSTQLLSKRNREVGRRCRAGKRISRATLLLWEAASALAGCERLLLLLRDVSRLSLAGIQPASALLVSPRPTLWCFGAIRIPHPQCLVPPPTRGFLRPWYPHTRCQGVCNSVLPSGKISVLGVNGCLPPPRKKARFGGSGLEA